ncbi:MAG: NAD(P)-dependent oxidoreductase [Ignavibacteriaceae bacterium]|nr:NAD(P)-dependent oxidoreductase [Ignavibacteriaceae bacterium]
MKKVLITGGSGLLGQYLNISASQKFNIFTTYKNNPGNCKEFPNSKVDILNEYELSELFQKVRPQVVIHSAAITNPLPKENQSSKEYFDTNVTATKSIAQLCENYRSKLIYISTDLVYAGYRGSFLKEDAKLIPATLYAETKLVGEMKVKESTENYLILRTALLYGFGLNHSRSHFQFIYDELKNNRPVKLFIDQFRTPISLKDSANIIADLVELDINEETINLGGIERVSRYELGEILCSIAGFDKSLLQKITMDEIPNFPKVADVSLNTEKLQALGLRPATIEENIREIIRNN